MKKIYLLFSILCFPILLFATEEPTTGGARSLSLGTASLTLSHPYSILNNQAAMAFEKEISFALYAENRFLQKELGYYSGGLTLPTKSGVFGLAVNYSGFDLYNEKKLGLAYGRLFTKNVSGGIQIDYLATSLSEYG